MRFVRVTVTAETDHEFRVRHDQIVAYIEDKSPDTRSKSILMLEYNGLLSQTYAVKETVEELDRLIDG